MHEKKRMADLITVLETTKRRGNMKTVNLTLALCLAFLLASCSPTATNQPKGDQEALKKVEKLTSPTPCDRASSRRCR
jgi:starvation-inducible outer membrane lipoprotein